MVISNEAISLKEASKFSGYHSDYLSFLIRSGKLNGQKIGRAWFVNQGELEVFLKQKENGKDVLSNSSEKTNGFILNIYSSLKSAFENIKKYFSSLFCHSLEEGNPSSFNSNANLDTRIREYDRLNGNDNSNTKLFRQGLKSLSKNIFVAVFTVGLILAIFSISFTAKAFPNIFSKIFGNFATVFLAGGSAQTNYQGKLTGTTGIAVSNNTYNIRFKLYATSTGGSPLWTETYCYSPDSGTTCNGTGSDSRVQVASGLFSTMLGSINSLSGIDFNQTLYLGVEIGGTSTTPVGGDWDGEMSPRKRIGTVPSAFVASNLNGVSDTQFVRLDTANATSTTGAVLTLTQNGLGNVVDFYASSTKVFYITSIGDSYFSRGVLASKFNGLTLATTTTGFSISTTSQSLLVIGSSTLNNANVSGTNTGDITLAGNSVANGLTLSGQALTLGLASGSATGTLSATDWTTFNNKVSSTTNALTNYPTYTYASSTFASTSWITSTFPTYSYASSTYATIASSTQWTTTGSNIYYNTGNVGVGIVSPNSLLHLGAGTVSVAPLGFTSGPLLSSPLAGKVEFLSDDFFATISSGPARKGIVLNDGTNLVAGRVPYATTNGRLTDEAALAYDATTDTLTAGTLSATEVGDSVFYGNVGIGTSSVSAVFDIYGTSSASTTDLFAISSSSNARLFTIKSSGNVGIGTSTPSAKFEVYGTTTGAIANFASSTNASALYIAANSNVGIGTTNPTFPLEVQTTNTDTNITSATGVLYHYTSGDMADGFGSSLNFKIGDSGANNHIGYMSGQRDGADNSGKLVFGVKSAGTWNDSALVIKNTGNVGIGTTSLGAKLEVAGVTTGNAFKVSGGATGFTTQNVVVNEYGTLQSIGRTDSAMNSLFGAMGIGDTYNRITLGLNTGTPFLGFGPGDATRDVFITRSAANTLRVSSDGSTGAGNLIINGNVGIGTTTPLAKLHITNSGTGDAFAISSSSNSRFFTIGYNGSTTIASLNNAGFVKSDANGLLYNDTNTYVSNAYASSTFASTSYVTATYIPYTGATTAVNLNAKALTNVLNFNGLALATTTTGFTISTTSQALLVIGSSTISGSHTGTSSGTNTGDVTLVNNVNGLTISGQALTMALASGSATGTLSATDWTTFNSKQAALGFTPYNATNPAGYMASTTVLSGFVAGANSAVTNADTLETSIEKLQGQVTARGVGSVTSVGLAMPTGYTISNSPVTTTGTLTAAVTAGYTGPFTTATGTTGTDFNIATTSSSLTLNIPTASASNRGLLSSADWTTFNNKGSGTVTAVSIATANGFSGSSSGGATPALTIVAGAITPTSVNGNTITTGTGRLTLGANTLVASGNATTSGTNTGDVTLVNNVNGLTISGQALTMALASGSATGTLSATDWTTFNNKVSNTYASTTFPSFAYGTSTYVNYTYASSTFAPISAVSQWTTNSSNIYYNTGNVGIGTTTPNAKLSVYGSSSAPTLDLFELSSSSNASLFVVKSSGNVGIGTTNPANILTIGSYNSANYTLASGSTTKQSLLSIDNNQLSQLEGGKYFGGVGIKENQWGLSNYGINWTQSNSISGSWNSVAMSSDGKIQSAVGVSGYIYYSRDYGMTWTRSNSISASWRNIAMSSDGKIQSASIYGDHIYNSKDYGVTWTPSNSDHLGVANIAMSSDGQIQSVIGAGVILRSTNYGVDWTLASSSAITWNDIAMSSDGKIQSAVSSNSGYVYYSTDYGVTWTKSSSISDSWSGIKMSSDGKIQSAVISGGYIYYSTDYGVTWSQSNSASASWYSIAMSSDGKIQSAGRNGNIYSSTDYGVTWSQTNSVSAFWYDIAMSSDGKIQSAVNYNSGYIYYSYANSSIFGNVGIGTTTPTAQLAIQAVAGSANQLFDIASSSGLSYLHVSSNGFVGIGTTTPALKLEIYGNPGSADIFGVSSSSNQRIFTIASDGDVGIGTTTPLARFAVYGRTGSNPIANFASSTNASVLLVAANNTVGIGTTTTAIPAAKLDVYGNAGTADIFGVSSSSNARLFTIKNTGYVGIGTSTPVTILQIGSAKFDGTRGAYANDRLQLLIGDGAGTGEGYATIMLSSIYNSANFPNYGIIFNNGPTTSSYDSWAIMNDGPAKANGGLKFAFSAQGTDMHTVTPFVTFQKSGNVGIGTSTPVTALSVIGTSTTQGLRISNFNVASFLAVDSSGNVIATTTPNTSQWTTLSSNIYYNLGNVGIGTTTPNAKLSIYGTSSAPTLDLFEISSSSNTALFTVKSSGNVGIGTTTPNNLLQVFGLIDFNNSAYGTKIGYQAGKNIITGADYNTFVGYQAGLSSSTGSTNNADGNTAVGYSSLSSNVSGTNNSSVGYSSLLYNTTGISNSAIGGHSLESNTTGSFNTANGASALSSNQTGSRNTAIGISALLSNVTGSNNIGIGNFAGAYEIDSSSNRLYIDNLDRGDFASGQSKSLIYGVSSTTLSAQTLTFNANVGVGTTTPMAKLDIYGTAGTGDIFAVSSSSNARLFTITSAGNVGFGGITNPANILTVGSYDSGNYIFASGSTTKQSLLSVDNNQISQLEGGMYFGKVGVKENQWGLSNYGVTWATSSSISSNWNDLAMSSDGKIQTAATLSGYLYYSRDYGVTWTQSSSISADWYSVAMSSDGKIQSAGTGGGYIYYSTDYGVTWIQSSSISANWLSMAMSSDGKVQTAGALGGYIYYSRDYGVTWTQSSSISSAWYNIAMSSDGKVQIAGTSGTGRIYYSRDYGVTWTQSNSNSASWLGVAMSSDGKIQSAVAGGSGYIYYSRDYGATWTQSSSISAGWYSIAMSSDGKIQTAGISSGYMYHSEDYGMTWTLSNSISAKWYSVEMSSDGKIQSSVAYGGYIYYSYSNSSILGNIGIGTSTPATTLSVQSKGTTDILNLFETDGTKVFTVLENGNVGIGTSTPQGIFDINYSAITGGQDPYTKLLIHANETSGSTALVDSSGVTKTITAYGNASTSNATGKFSNSAAFDGTGDSLRVPDSGDWDFGTGDFTVDMWINARSVSGYGRLISIGANDGGANNMWFLGLGSGWGGGTKMNWGYRNASGYTETTTSALTVNTGTWYHVAVVRSGNTLTYYFAGSAVGTQDLTGVTINGGVTGAIIGSRYNANVSDIIEPWNGYIDEVRISKGIARWTGNFTPPTSAYSSIGGGAQTSAFMVASNGYVGIGTTTPTASLSVLGTTRFASLGSAGATLVTDSLGNVNVSSDERLKDIQGDYERGLADIMKINPIQYKWKPETGYDTENVYSGFSAQNMSLAIPEAVATDINGNLTLADRPVIAALVNSVKQIGSFITKIQDGIAYLKNIVVENFAVGSKKNPAGITMYDEKTGDPYCVKITNGVLMNEDGVCKVPVVKTATVLGAIKNNKLAKADGKTSTSTASSTLLATNTKVDKKILKYIEDYSAVITDAKQVKIQGTLKGKEIKLSKIMNINDAPIEEDIFTATVQDEEVTATTSAEKVTTNSSLATTTESTDSTQATTTESTDSASSGTEVTTETSTQTEEVATTTETVVEVATTTEETATTTEEIATTTEPVAEVATTTEEIATTTETIVEVATTTEEVATTTEEIATTTDTIIETAPVTEEIATTTEDEKGNGKAKGKDKKDTTSEDLSLSASVLGANISISQGTLLLIVLIIQVLMLLGFGVYALKNRKIK